MRCTVAPEQWLHIVGVSDGGSVKLYINGEMVAEAATKKAGATLTHPTVGSQFLVVGSSPDAATQAPAAKMMFQGKIADARIYSAVLNQEQITKLYAAYN